MTTNEIAAETTNRRYFIHKEFRLPLRPGVSFKSIFAKKLMLIKVGKVADIEMQLGIYELAQFTPKV